MATKGKPPAVRETVPTDRAAYFRQVDTRFGKDFGDAGTRLFDPALPEDKMLQRSLAPWVAKTAMWNLIQRGRGRETTTKPLTKLEDVQRKAIMQHRALERKGIFHGPRDVPAIRKIWGERILGKKGEAYRRGLADPRRPIQDWDAQRVSPLTFNPRTGEYDR